MKAVLWFGGLMAIFGAIIAFQLMHFGDLTSSVAVLGPAYTVTLDGATVHVMLARTPAEQERGLGGRDSLAVDQGMLFVFPKDGEYAFWMKDMKFSIDILWLAQDGTVVYIVPNLSPSTYPQTFGPSKPARFVLEVPAGFVAAHWVQVGDRAHLP